jgi:hypothetical protein
VDECGEVPATVVAIEEGGHGVPLEGTKLCFPELVAIFNDVDSIAVCSTAWAGCVVSGCWSKAIGVVCLERMTCGDLECCTLEAS